LTYLLGVKLLPQPDVMKFQIKYLAIFAIFVSMLEKIDKIMETATR